MAIDTERMFRAAALAALEPSPSPPAGRRKLPPVPALMLGAGTVAAWRLVRRHRSGSVLAGVERRLLEYEARRFGDSIGS